MNFLVPITVYSYMEETGGLTTKHYLFNSPSAEYFSKGHLPFAITLSFVFFALPMVLLFVYTHLHGFRRYSINSLTLRTFMEVYQGYNFKDGTNNTRDFRFFAGFLVPLILNLTFLLTKSSMYYPIGSVWILIYLPHSPPYVPAIQMFTSQPHHSLDGSGSTGVLLGNDNQ